MKKLLIILLLFAGPALAGDKTLQFTWEHDLIDLAGFNLYMSETPNIVPSGTPFAVISYTGQTTLETSEVITSPDGVSKTYYFVMTAYDSDGNESGPSNEVSDTIDFEAPNAPFTLTVKVAMQ